MAHKIKATPARMLLFKEVGLLEHDPSSQYRFNRFWAIIWALGLLAIPFVPVLYGHSISALIIQEVSLWANFATHFGSMSSALAAQNTSKTVDDVNDNVEQIGDVLGVE